MNPKIFFSYNPGVKVEESTALRLQTISSLYYVTIYLTDRLDTNQLKDSTKNRILDSNIFVMFSTKKLSKTVLEYHKSLSFLLTLPKSFRLK